jgi:hypothetical protein
MGIRATSQAALAYEEPGISTTLNLAGLLLALNLLNSLLDKFLYCGLIGQLFIGILWGTPGAQWLDQDTEIVVQQLGYIGLIMLVYEGNHLLKMFCSYDPLADGHHRRPVNVNKISESTFSPFSICCPYWYQCPHMLVICTQRLGVG